MKETIIVLCTILAVSTAMVMIDTKSHDTPHLLGEKACTWGPSYWCQNLTTAAGCKATKHCIPNVWEKMQVPEDTDSVCNVCKDMVQQARDQLESNQTQEDLKAVFEGSCALMHIKPIVYECDKLVDEFIPELVESLASQMNPSVVCSVAGLCNSAHIDKLLEDYEKQSDIEKVEKSVSLEKDEYNPDECTKCYTIAHHMQYKFSQSSRDQVLERFLYICGELSSFSDACSSIILTYFDNIYSHIKKNFDAENVCHLSGQCSAKFHVHKDEDEKTPEVEIRPLSSVGMVEVGDDLPCKLCEQLVGHLRDLLVANTTETEFQEVLEGLCKQTKSFAPECKSIVDEYYPEIYTFLTQHLNSAAVCQMGGLCPAPGKMVGPIAPLLPEHLGNKGVKIMNENKPEIETFEAEDMQLPFERLTAGITLIDDTYCSSCEFTIDYIKKTVKDMKNRNEVELVVREMKNALPGIKGQSGEENFLVKYEKAVVELILQGRELSEICQLLAVCPTKQLIETWESIPTEMTVQSSIKDKPNCPLCLFAVTKLYELVKDDKTEATIEAALDKLCHELPKSLNNQCVDLVKIYSKELISLLLSDMTPQEVCASLKLCDEPTTKSTIGEKIAAVPQDTVEGRQACAVCEYVLHYLQQVITDPKAENEVKQVMDKVCKKLPSSIENDCNQFIDAYGDAVVAILAQEIDPSQVCPKIHLCPSAELLESWAQAHDKEVGVIEQDNKPNCPLCLFGVTQLYNAIKDNKTEASIEAAMDKLCVHLPKSLVKQCDSFVQNYSKRIMEMIIADFTPQEVCAYLKLCDEEKKVGPESHFYPLDKDGEIMTNEIPDYPIDVLNFPTKSQDIDSDKSIEFESERNVKVSEDAECVACEFIMQYVEKIIGTRKSKDEIEHALHNVCAHLPKRMTKKCDEFVNEYGEIVISLLTQEVSPKEICTIIDLCKPESKEIKESIADCAICQNIVMDIERLSVDGSKTLEKVMSEVCEILPNNQKEKCNRMIRIYGQHIANLIKEQGDTQNICSKVSLCAANNFLVQLKGDRKIQNEEHYLGSNPCTWGISYWCLNEETAKQCKATELCKQKGHLPK